MKWQDAQTTASLANIRFTTSIPGVARNLKSSWGCDIILYFVLLFLSASLPHLEFRQNLPDRLNSYRLFIQSDPFSRLEIIDVSILVFGVSNPVWISASPHLQFKKFIYIRVRCDCAISYAGPSFPCRLIFFTYLTLNLCPPVGIKPLVSGFRNRLRKTFLHADAIVIASRKSRCYLSE